MADTKLTALTEVSVPALTDIAYTVADPSGSPASDKITWSRLGGLLYPSLTNGRLTLATGNAVPATDQLAKGTIYYTATGNDGIVTACTILMVLYDGTRFVEMSFSELSLALTVTSGKNYDVFIDYNSGTPQMALSAAWTNDTTRADALAAQGPIVVKSGTTTLRWVGTIRASATNKTADSAGGTTTQVGGTRFVWNAYNQARQVMSLVDTTSTWSYTTNTVRAANGASANRVEYVTGIASTALVAQVVASVQLFSNTSTGAHSGIGIDSTSQFSGLLRQTYCVGTVVQFTLGGEGRFYPGLGYHFAQWCESGADTNCLFLSGVVASGAGAAGITAEILG